MATDLNCKFEASSAGKSVSGNVLARNVPFLTTAQNQSHIQNNIPLMVDGLRVKIALQHQPLKHREEFRHIGAEGVVEQERIKYSDLITSPLGSTVQLVSGDITRDLAETMLIVGNPASWLQGHNLFGSGDLRPLVPRFLESVLTVAQIPISSQEKLLLACGAFEVHEVTLNHQFRMPSSEAADRFMRVARELATKGKQLKHAIGNESPSVYFGTKGARGSYVTVLIYHKTREFAQHRLPAPLRPYQDDLRMYSAGIIRFEYTFKRGFVKKNGLIMGWNWAPSQIMEVVASQFSNIQLPTNVSAPQASTEALRRDLRDAYDLWRAGFDMRSRYPRSTFYRMKRGLKALGIDITQPPSIQERMQERDWSELLVPENAVGVPGWALGTPLFFDPQSSGH